jgi:hypothetical protein
MTLRRPAAALALLAAAGAATALILAGNAPSKRPPPVGDTSASGTATVERRDLVASDTESGTLSHAAPQTVYNRLSGTITWLPHVGQTIKPGGVLFRVDGRPVILMDGATPAYRALAAGVSRGADVLQLNRDLVALGFDPNPIAIDDEWQTATTVGVERLQRSLGETETGALAFGRVVFLPGTQLVSTVDAALGGGGSGSGTGSPSTGSASDPSGAGRREYAALEEPAGAGTSTTPPQPARTTTTPGTGTEAPTENPRRVRTLEAQLARLKSELGRLKHKGSPKASGSEKPASSGSPGSGGSPREPEGASAGATPTAILATTSTRIVVKVALEAGKQNEARIGETVTVALPDGAEVRGTVTAVSTVAQAATGSQSTETTGGTASSTVPVTITLHGRHAGAALDQAQVSVNFVQAVARDVLSVPVTALLATGGARYALQEAASPHRVIPVSTGLFAAGDVQVSGAGIHPGLRVSDSQG